MGRIALLSGGVASHLRSTTILSDFGQAVEELICNSLDAGATQVCVQLDEGDASVKVEDDGHGISRDDLKLVGVEVIAATSKLHTLEELEAGVRTLGFRGEALSSLSDISLLEITSRVQGCPHTYCKIIKGNSTVSLGLCSQPRARGTTVVSRDIFYNRPVRRKLFYSSHKKALHSVKERILRLALAHPYVSFIVRDSSRLEEVLHIRQHTSLYGTLQDVFGCELCCGLQEVDFGKGQLRLSGYISKSFFYTSSKAVQYLYINHRFVHKTPFHKVMNAWGTRNVVQPTRDEELDISTGRQGYPAFVLNLSCKMSEYDVTFEASKTYVEFKDWSPVLSFLEDVLLTSWGNAAGKEQAAKSTGKRKSWCRRNSPSKSTLEWKISPSGVEQTRMSNSCAVPLQSHSSFVPEPSSKRIHKNKSLEEHVFQSPDIQQFTIDLQTKDILSPSFAPLYEPSHLDNVDKLLDPDMDPLPFLGMYSTMAPAISKCQSPDVLLLGSPDMQALPVPSSPVVSDGSWGCGFGAYREDLSPTESLTMEYGPAQQGLPSETSEPFPDLHHSLSGTELSESLAAVKDDFGSRVRFQGAPVTNEWMLRTATSPDKLFQLDIRAWDEPACEQFPEAINADEAAEDSYSDVGEAHFDPNMLRWSGRHGKCRSPVYAPRQFDTSDLENYWVRASPQPISRRSPARISQEQVDHILDSGSLLHQNSGLKLPEQLKRSVSRPPFYKARPTLSLYNNNGHFRLPAPEVFQDEATAFPEESLTNHTSIRTAEAGKDWATDLEKVTNVEEFGIAMQGGQPREQVDQACAACPESPTHDLLLSKWHSTGETTVAHPGDEGLSQNVVASMYKVWLNPCMRANTNDVLDLSAGRLGSSSSSLLPDVVTKESLRHARVLQQVDTKFIAVVAHNVLLLVDQHAADERVRLEEFRAHVLAADKKQTSMLLDEKHELALGLAEQQTLHTYQQQIEDWGWHFQAVPVSEELSKHTIRPINGGACKYQLTGVPCILGVNLTTADFEEYLQQLGATHGTSVPPPAVVRLLNYKSCRGAIMFGDALLPAECRQLVNHLKQTSLCFQCAHGRPTMVPLVNLLTLRRRFGPQVDSNGLAGTTTSEFNHVQSTMQTDGEALWHRLADRPLSLLRARKRLHQSQST